MTAHINSWRNITAILLMWCTTTCISQPKRLLQPELTKLFYLQGNNELFWFGADGSCEGKRAMLINFLDSSIYSGLAPGKYRPEVLKDISSARFTDSTTVAVADRLFTDAALAIAKDLETGIKSDLMLGYDELSDRCLQEDKEGLLASLSRGIDTSSLRSFFEALEPNDTVYLQLKAALRQQLASSDQVKLFKLRITLNFYRWIAHFRLQRYIIVNIPAATLSYYENGTAKLNMRAVVGKATTKTPRFAAHCNEIILYPYWNVPKSIAPEIWSVALKNRAILDIMNLKVIDSKGREVDKRTIHWEKYNKYNVPYRLRQSTGCDNALGVIKFNLTSPYGVYIHDTNLKPAFSLNDRYFSHGCIRIEKPVELGNYLTESRIDEKLLTSCIRNQKPMTLKLSDPIPVFVIYLPCGISTDGVVTYYRDIYQLL